jgi:hypothetical protein
MKYIVKKNLGTKSWPATVHVSTIHIMTQALVVFSFEK